MSFFSFSRFSAMVGKEFVQMRRDRLTFAMLIGLPLVQLILFGYAINSDPRQPAHGSPFRRQQPFLAGRDRGHANEHLLQGDRTPGLARCRRQAAARGAGPNSP